MTLEIIDGIFSVCKLENFRPLCRTQILYFSRGRIPKSRSSARLIL